MDILKVKYISCILVAVLFPSHLEALINLGPQPESKPKPALVDACVGLLESKNCDEKNETIPATLPDDVLRNKKPAASSDGVLIKDNPPDSSSVNPSKASISDASTPPILTSTENINAADGDLTGIYTSSASTENIDSADGDLTGIHTSPTSTEDINTTDGVLTGIHMSPASTKDINTFDGDITGIYTSPTSIEDNSVTDGDLTGIHTSPTSNEDINTTDGDLTGIHTIPTSTEDINNADGDLTGIHTSPTSTEDINTTNGDLAGIHTSPVSPENINAADGDLTGLHTSPTSAEDINTTDGDLTGIHVILASTEYNSATDDDLTGIHTSPASTEDINNADGDLTGIHMILASTEDISAPDEDFTGNHTSPTSTEEFLNTTDGDLTGIHTGPTSPEDNSATDGDITGIYTSPKTENKKMPAIVFADAVQNDKPTALSNDSLNKDNPLDISGADISKAPISDSSFPTSLVSAAAENINIADGESTGFHSGLNSQPTLAIASAVTNSVWLINEPTTVTSEKFNLSAVTVVPQTEFEQTNQTVSDFFLKGTDDPDHDVSAADETWISFHSSETVVPTSSTPGSGNTTATIAGSTLKYVLNSSEVSKTNQSVLVAVSTEYDSELQSPTTSKQSSKDKLFPNGNHENTIITDATTIHNESIAAGSTQPVAIAGSEETTSLGSVTGDNLVLTATQNSKATTETMLLIQTESNFECAPERYTNGLTNTDLPGGTETISENRLCQSTVPPAQTKIGADVNQKGCNNKANAGNTIKEQTNITRGRTSINGADIDRPWSANMKEPGEHDDKEDSDVDDSNTSDGNNTSVNATEEKTNKTGGWTNIKGANVDWTESVNIEEHGGEHDDDEEDSDVEDITAKDGNDTSVHTTEETTNETGGLTNISGADIDRTGSINIEEHGEHDDDEEDSDVDDSNAKDGNDTSVHGTEEKTNKTGGWTNVNGADIDRTGSVNIEEHGGEHDDDEEDSDVDDSNTDDGNDTCVHATEDKTNKTVGWININCTDIDRTGSVNIEEHGGEYDEEDSYVDDSNAKDGNDTSVHTTEEKTNETGGLTNISGAAIGRTWSFNVDSNAEDSDTSVLAHLQSEPRLEYHVSSIWPHILQIQASSCTKSANDKSYPRNRPNLNRNREPCRPEPARTLRPPWYTIRPPNRLRPPIPQNNGSSHPIMPSPTAYNNLKHRPAPKFLAGYLPLFQRFKMQSAMYTSPRPVPSQTGHQLGPKSHGHKKAYECQLDSPAHQNDRERQRHRTALQLPPSNGPKCNRPLNVNRPNLNHLFQSQLNTAVKLHRIYPPSPIPKELLRRTKDFLRPGEVVPKV